MAESGKRVTVHCEVCDSPVEIEVTQEDLSKQEDGILRVMMALSRYGKERPVNQ